MDAGVESVRAFLARAEDERRAGAAARERVLRERIPAAAALLRGLGATRIWVFGSLVWGPLHEGSDLDLAVEGLAPERFFEAYRALWDLAGEPVDLVAIERAADTLRARILAGGEVVGP